MDALSALTRREREIMNIIFESKEATLGEIQQRMTDAPTRSALRSLLMILEEKGHLSHDKRGREFVFRPTVATEKVARTALGRLLGTFFDGSLRKAVSSYLSDPKAKLSDAELDDLAAFVEQARQQRQTPKAAKGKKTSK